MENESMSGGKLPTLIGPASSKLLNLRVRLRLPISRALKLIYVFGGGRHSTTALVQAPGSCP